MNIVLDTNSLIMSIAPKSPYRKVWNAFLKGDYNLCVSNEIIEEYSEVLSRNISPQVSGAIVYAILSRPNVIRKDPHYTFALIEADKDDNKFVDCAIAANAKCIVTEDKHFRVFRNPFADLAWIYLESLAAYINGVFIINCVGVNGRFAYLSFALTPAACLRLLMTRLVGRFLFLLRASLLVISPNCSMSLKRTGLC